MESPHPGFAWVAQASFPPEHGTSRVSLTRPMNLDPRTRFLYGSPLANPKISRYLTIILALLVWISTGVIVKFKIASLSPDAIGVFMQALFYAALLSLVPLGVLLYLDRRERESPWLYAAMFLWGALIATGITKPISYLLSAGGRVPEGIPSNLYSLLFENTRETLTTVLAIPTVEEVAKGLGVLLVFWLLRAEFDGARDGFIYGALVGIGFNLLDSAFLVADTYARSGAYPWVQFFAIDHSLLGMGGHALYTGLFGMGLGLARQTTRAWLRFAAPVTGWLLGLVAHMVGSLMGLLTVFLVSLIVGRGVDVSQGLETLDPAASSFWIATLATTYISIFWSFPFLAIAVVLLWQSGVWERQVIREELDGEAPSVITSEEYETVKADRIFRTRRIEAVHRRMSRAIVRAQNELAIRKWQVKHMGRSPEDDVLVASWREELGRLREPDQVEAKP